MFKKRNNTNTVEKFRSEEHDYITFEDLSEIPLNKVNQLYPELEGAVEFTRISSNSNNLMFTVSMKKGQLWLKHKHDCVEIILVYKGKLRDLVQDKLVQRAETLVFKKEQPHYVLAEEDSIFYVEFKKPLK